jgi:putative NADPH-quinone reductase
MSTLEFYFARAAQCSREAEAATLANVRERHLTARDVWLQMADRLERTSQGRADVAAEKQKLADADLVWPMTVAPTA